MIFSHIITIYGNNIIQLLLNAMRKKKRIDLHEKTIFTLDQTEVNITLKGRKKHNIYRNRIVKLLYDFSNHELTFSIFTFVTRFVLLKSCSI